MKTIKRNGVPVTVCGPKEPVHRNAEIEVLHGSIGSSVDVWHMRIIRQSYRDKAENKKLRKNKVV